jgi:hypothetical protein
MHRIKFLVVVAVLTASMLVASAAPASAQGYTGWIEHPYPSAGLWYCDYYAGEYWCQGNGGTWFPANPDWYNAAYAEMMSIYGQGVL